MKATTTTSKATTKKDTEVTFKFSKETKNAVCFVAEGLESSNIYFKKSELEALGLEDKKEFVMVIKA